MSLTRRALQYLGVRAKNPPDLVRALRNPTASDKSYVKGTLWLNTAGLEVFIWSGTDWLELSFVPITGTATLTGASTTVTSTAVTADSRIYVSYETVTGTGILSAAAADISPGVSFKISSTDGTDTTSTVNWEIIN